MLEEHSLQAQNRNLMAEQIHTVTFRFKDDPERRLERVFTNKRAAETFVKTLPAEIEVITWSDHDSGGRIRVNPHP